MDFGFPALVVPEEDVRATGSADPARDAYIQRRLGDPDAASLPDGPRVLGELLLFDDPERRLPALDRLEGFHSEGNSLYRRVLVPVETSERCTLAWTYTIERPSGVHLPGGRWPD